MSSATTDSFSCRRAVAGLGEDVERHALERLCVCPITMRRMRDPVVDPMGFTYERVAFNEALARRPGICPMTNEPYAPLPREEDDLLRVLSAFKIAVPNRLVRDIIRELGETEAGDIAQREERFVPACVATKSSPEPTWTTAWHAWLPLHEREREAPRPSEPVCAVEPFDGCGRFLAWVGCVSPLLITATALTVYFVVAP